MLITATATLPFWNHFAHKYNKKTIYLIGVGMWFFVQLLILTIRPGQVGYIIILTFIAGWFVSNMHVLPEAIFPDVIDWGELQTNKRQEGMYYGAVNFLRKLSSALAIFIILQVLGWFGYQSPPEGVTQFTQPASALLAIRILTGPAVSVLLLGAFLFTWRYPLTREKHNRIHRSLLRRRKNFHDK
jgi:GPH family glycoside/pentoside/hexuronide:cation symporter